MLTLPAVVLLLYAKELKFLEMRHPIPFSGPGKLQENDAPRWAEVIPELARLHDLRVLKLSFPVQLRPVDQASITAAGKVLQDRSVHYDRKLILQQIIPPQPKLPNKEDVIYSSEEILIR